jgi:hypothetical protein
VRGCRCVSGERGKSCGDLLISINSVNGRKRKRSVEKVRSARAYR